MAACDDFRASFGEDFPICWLCQALKERNEAQAVAITLLTALEVIRRRGLDPEVQGIFDRTKDCRPSWLALPPFPEDQEKS